MHKIGDKDYYLMSQDNLAGKLSYADYLTINNERKPEWVGKLAEEYGLLNKDFDNNDFSNIYDGYKPNGDKAIKGAGTNQHQAGEEMCLTLPKSLSVLYAVADEDTKQSIMEIIHSSTDEILKETETLLLPSNQSSKYRKNLDTDKTQMVASKFTHYENRNVDPHLHVHIQIFNQAKFFYTDKEPKVQAIDTRKLFQHQKELSQKVNSLIINKLKDSGIKVVEDNKNEFSFKVAGIPDEVCEKLSDRSKEIKQWEQENKLKFSSVADRDKAYQLEQIRKVSANDKQELSYSQIMNVFKEKIDKADFDFEKFKKLNTECLVEDYKEEHKLREKLFDKETLLKIEDKLISIEGSFSRTKFNEVFLSEFKHDLKTDDLNDLNRVLNLGFEEYSKEIKFVEVDKAKNIYTTERVINTENNIVKISKELSIKDYKIEMSIKNNAVIDFQKYVNDNNFKLNKGQLEACQLIYRSNKSLLSITGDAGTGKTTTAIKFANELHKHTNSVYGLATGGKTSTALQEADIKNTKNIQEFLTNYDNGNIKFEKPPTLIIDEAGMVSSNHMEKLLEITQKHKGNIILVGDTKQLNAVEFGSALTNINNNIPKENQSRLITNMRQKNELAKNIAESFRDKEIDKGFKLLEDNKLLHIDKTQDKVFDKLVNDYFNDKNTIDSKLIIAKDNSVVNKLNDKVRAKLIEDKILNIDNQVELQIKIGNSKNTQERFFVENDRIVINQKTRIDKNTVLENGTLATIKSIDKDTNVLTLSVLKNDIETTVKLDTEKHKNFNHSYCQTAYKSQGQTVNNAYVFSTGKTTANQSYVEFSRHKDNVNLYLVEGTEAEFKRNAKISQDKFNAFENVACKKHYSKFTKDLDMERRLAIRIEELKQQKLNTPVINTPVIKPEVVYNLTPLNKLKNHKGPTVDRNFEEQKQVLAPVETPVIKKPIQKLKLSLS